MADFQTDADRSTLTNIAASLFAAQRPLMSLKCRLVTFAWWGGLVGIAFFGIYPTTNWLASLQSKHYSLFVAGELSLPFIPEFIWIYFSMFVLFLLPPFLLNPEELKESLNNLSRRAQPAN